MKHMSKSDFEFNGQQVEFAPATRMEFIPSRLGKSTGINFSWLAEFSSAFEQLIEGEDGDAVGRQLWKDSDSAWRAARANGADLAYEDATTEAEAWNNQ